MFRLRDISLRVKLNALLGGYTLTVLVALGLTGYLLDKYRVGGPVYREVIDRKNLADQMTPPPLLIGRVFLANVVWRVAALLDVERPGLGVAH